jgi:hypothetical protein
MCRLLFLWIVCRFACPGLCWGDDEESCIRVCSSWSDSHNDPCSTCKLIVLSSIPIKADKRDKLTVSVPSKVHFYSRLAGIRASHFQHCQALDGMAWMHFRRRSDCIYHCKCHSGIQRPRLTHRCIAGYFDVAATDGCHVVIRQLLLAREPKRQTDTVVVFHGWLELLHHCCRDVPDGCRYVWLCRGHS